MSRITDTEVKNIINSEITDISEFISTADLIVSEQLEGKGLTEDRLKLIELYLAAHYLTLREKQTRYEQYGAAANAYQGKTGMFLLSSFYGQTAVELDTTGTLREFGSQTVEMELL